MWNSVVEVVDHIFVPPSHFWKVDDRVNHDRGTDLKREQVSFRDGFFCSCSSGVKNPLCAHVFEVARFCTTKNGKWESDSDLMRTCWQVVSRLNGSLQEKITNVALIGNEKYLVTIQFDSKTRMERVVWKEGIAERTCWCSCMDDRRNNSCQHIEAVKRYRGNQSGPIFSNKTEILIDGDFSDQRNNVEWATLVNSIGTFALSSLVDRAKTDLDFLTLENEKKEPDNELPESPPSKTDPNSPSFNTRGRFQDLDL